MSCQFGGGESILNIYTKLTEKETTKESLQVFAEELVDFHGMAAGSLRGGGVAVMDNVLKSGGMLIMNIYLLNLLLGHKNSGKGISSNQDDQITEFPSTDVIVGSFTHPPGAVAVIPGAGELVTRRREIFEGTRDADWGMGDGSNIYDPVGPLNWILEPEDNGLLETLFANAEVVKTIITNTNPPAAGGTARHLTMPQYRSLILILTDLRRFVLLKNLINEAISETAGPTLLEEYLVKKFRKMTIPPRIHNADWTMNTAADPMQLHQGTLYKNSFHGQVNLFVENYIDKKILAGRGFSFSEHFSEIFDQWNTNPGGVPDMLSIISRDSLWALFTEAATAAAAAVAVGHRPKDTPAKALLNDEGKWDDTLKDINAVLAVHAAPWDRVQQEIIDRIFKRFKCGENNQYKVLLLHLFSVGDSVRRVDAPHQLDVVYPAAEAADAAAAATGAAMGAAAIATATAAGAAAVAEAQFTPYQIKELSEMFEHLKRELDARLQIADALWDDMKGGSLEHIKTCLGNLSSSYDGSPKAGSTGATVTDSVTGDSENGPGDNPAALVEAQVTFKYLELDYFTSTEEQRKKYKDDFISGLKDQYRESFKAEITIVGEVSVTKGSTIFSATIRLRANQSKIVDEMVGTIPIIDKSGKRHVSEAVNIVNQTPVANPSAPDANQSPQDGEPLSLLTDKMRAMSRTLKSEIPDIGPVVEAAEDLRNDVVSVSDTIVNRSTIAQSIARKLQNEPTDNVYDTSSTTRLTTPTLRTLNLSIYNNDPDRLTALPSLERGTKLTPEVIKELTKLTNAIFEGVLGKDPEQIGRLFSLGDVRTRMEEFTNTGMYYTIKYVVKRQGMTKASTVQELVLSLEKEISAQHGRFVHLEGFGEGYQLGTLKEGEVGHSRMAKTKFMIPRSGDYKVAIGPTDTILHIFDGSPLKDATAVLDLRTNRMTEITKGFKISQDTYKDYPAPATPLTGPTLFRLHLAQGIVSSCKEWIRSVVPRAGKPVGAEVADWTDINEGLAPMMREIMTRFSPCRCEMVLDTTKLDFNTTPRSINLKIVPSGSNPFQVKIELKDNFANADGFCDFLNKNDKMKEFKIGVSKVKETLIVIGTIDIFLADQAHWVGWGKGRPRQAGYHFIPGEFSMENALGYLRQRRQFDTPQYSYLTVEDIDSSPFIERIEKHWNYGEFLLNWCGPLGAGWGEKCGEERFTRVHGGYYPEIVFHVPAPANEAVGGAAPESDININLDDDEKEIFTDLYKSLNYDLISSYCVPPREKTCSEHRIAKNSLRNDIKKIIKEEIDETPPSASGTGTGTGKSSNQAELDKLKKEIEEANRKANEAKSAEQKRMFEQQSRMLKQQMDAMKSMAAKGVVGTGTPGTTARPGPSGPPGTTPRTSPPGTTPRPSEKGPIPGAPKSGPPGPGEKKPGTAVEPGPGQPISAIPGELPDIRTDEESKDDDKDDAFKHDRSKRKIIDDDDNKKDTEEQNQKNIIVDLFKKSPDGTIKMTDQELEDLLIDQIKITHKYDLLKQETFKLLDQNPDKLEQENKENKEKIKYLESKVFEILIQFINNQKSQKSKGVNLRNLNSKLLQYIKELKGDDSDISLMNTEKYIEILESLDSEILTVQPTTAVKTKSKSRKQLGKKSMKQRVNNRKKKKKTLGKDKKKTKGKSKKTPIKEKKISILKPKRTPTKKRIGSPNKAFKRKISPKNLQLIKTPQKQSNILAYQPSQPIKASNTKFINRY